jgi:hypothetical protein
MKSTLLNEWRWWKNESIPGVVSYTSPVLYKEPRDTANNKATTEANSRVGLGMVLSQMRTLGPVVPGKRARIAASPASRMAGDCHEPTRACFQKRKVQNLGVGYL